MKSIRLLPVVVMAIAALLVLKTLGLVTTGSYILGGVTTVQAEEGGGEAAAPAAGGDAADTTITMPDEPTMADSSPTMDDADPTIGQADAAGGHGAAPAEGEAAPADHGAEAAAPEADHGEAAPEAEGDHAAAEDDLPDGMQVVCPPTDAAAVAHAPAPAEGEAAPADAVPVADEHAAEPADSEAAFAAGLTDCVPLVDAVPTELGPDGVPKPLTAENGQSLSEKGVLESLSSRRDELEAYQQELDLRASLVNAAEKKIDERQATLEALETQISTLVDQRKELETGQFAGIVTLYENMKPKDAAAIFNSLDIEVLLRVAKAMNPRKMSPILAAMEAPRAQELTVRMAALADQPAEEMTPDDLAALPQIVGQ